MKKHIISIVFLCFITIFSNNLFSQNEGILYLRDAASGEAIENVHYFYQDGQGITGPDGKLVFSLPITGAIRLSHINYGIIHIGREELEDLYGGGIFKLQQVSMPLSSVDILGVRPLKDSRESIKLRPMEMMSHDAGAILTRVPFISGIRKGGGYGYDPVLRGFKYSQVGILIDGIQTSTVACPNRMDPPTSQISVNTISSVEVHKGPYSLRYGNNIGGLINFISSNPEMDKERGIYSRVSGGFESNGSVIRTEALAGMKGERSMYQLAGSWHKGSDYIDGNGSSVPASFTRGNIGLGARFRPTEHQEISAKVTRNFARNADYAALPMDLRSDDTWLFHLGHQGWTGKDNRQVISTSAYASLVDHMMDNLDKQLDPRMVNAETVVKTRNFGARSEYRHTGNSFVFTSGIDFRYENADGYRTREFLMGPNTGNKLTDNVWQNGRIFNAGVFAEYNRTSQQWRYSLSGRADLNTSDALDPDPDFSALYTSLQSSQFNPGITGGIEYLGKNFAYGLWAGRVQRSGNLSERFMNSFPVGLDPYELIGNTELKSEVNNQADLIIELKSAKKTQIELDIFYAFVQNFISSTIRDDLSPKMPSAPGVRQYDNIDRAVLSGFELSFNQVLPLHLSYRMDLAATRGVNKVMGTPLPEIPPVDIRASLAGSYLGNSLSPSINFRYVLQQSRVSAEFGETVTPSFWLIDLDISYDAFGKLTFAAGIRNLFDVAYYEHLNRSVLGSGRPISDPGRNFFLGVSISLN